MIPEAPEVQRSSEELTDRQLEAVLHACNVLAARDDDFSRRHSTPDAIEAIRKRHFLQKRRTLDELRAVARKKIERTSVQTVPEIIRAKSWEARVAWIVLLLIALFGCSYQIYAVVEDFLEAPTATKLDFIRPKSLEYPTLSICPLTERNLNEHLAGPDMLSGKLTRDYINAVEWGLGMVRGMDYPWIYDRNDTLIDEAYRSAIQEHGSMIEAKRDLQRRYGLTCWTFFRACYDHLNTYFNCCEAFEPHYNMHGICFSTKPGYLKAAGDGNLEAVRFLIWNYPRIDLVVGENGTELSRDFDKYVIGLMPSTQLDQSPQYPNIVYLEQGESVFYHVKNKRIIRRKPTVSGPCFSEQKLNVFRDFTINNCDWERIFFGRLNVSCELPITALLSGRETVDNPCDLETIREIYDMVGDRDLCHYWCVFSNQLIETNCSQPLCESERYSHTNTKIAAELATQVEMEVQIQFDALEIELITEVKRLGFNDAIGVIGGIFGLWVGASIISLVHILGICFSIAHEAIKSKVGKKLKHRPSIDIGHAVKKKLSTASQRTPDSPVRVVAFRSRSTTQ